MAGPGRPPISMWARAAGQQRVQGAGPGVARRGPQCRLPRYAGGVGGGEGRQFGPLLDTPLLRHITQAASSAGRLRGPDLGQPPSAQPAGRGQPTHSAARKNQRPGRPVTRAKDEPAAEEKVVGEPPSQRAAARGQRSCTGWVRSEPTIPRALLYLLSALPAKVGKI